jgi:hypothetical protein
LSQELKIVIASFTATHDKPTSKSAALDATMILRDEIGQVVLEKLMLAKSEEKFKAAEEELKT